MITVDRNLPDDTPIFAQSGMGEDRSVCTVGDIRGMLGQITRLTAAAESAECEAAEGELEKQEILHKYTAQCHLVAQLVAQLKSAIDSKAVWADRENAKSVLAHMEQEQRGASDE